MADWEPVLTARWGREGVDTIDGYLESGGYSALKKAVTPAFGAVAVPGSPPA
jgi:hypothetical protein